MINAYVFMLGSHYEVEQYCIDDDTAFDLAWRTQSKILPIERMLILTFDIWTKLLIEVIDHLQTISQDKIRSQVKSECSAFYNIKIEVITTSKTIMSPSNCNQKLTSLRFNISSVTRQLVYYPLWVHRHRWEFVCFSSVLIFEKDLL